MRLFLLLVLLFNFLRPADSSAGLPNIALTPSLFDNLNPIQKSYWLKLLHYHKAQSRADGEHFFLSSFGKSNPGAELDSTILAFQDPKAKSGWFNYHPQCVFRERYNFLSKLGLLKDLPKINCPEFDEWKKGLNAESLTLVFSSSYPNNPSSLFGHTLIRLNQKNKQGDLLDYSIAFSAMPEKEDLGLVFAFKGMFGGYKGLLEITKYYTKVNEYNDGESRDLIEYDLNMSPDELDRFINHVWEIYQTTYFDYFFADENCSAVLVDILAVPFEGEDVNSHERWYYLPSEMIKRFKSIPGRVRSEHFRPSLKKQLERTLQKLSPEDLTEVKKLSSSFDFPKDYQNIKALDGVIALLNFTRYRTKDRLSNYEKMIFRKSLIQRSQLPQQVQSGSLTETKLSAQHNLPDKSHQPQKFSAFLRSENTHSMVGIEFKEGYHDLMSNDEGYDPFSQFDFFTGSLIYDKTLNRISFDQLTFVNLTSLHPYRFYDPQFSWTVKIVDERIYDLNCDLCHKFSAKAYMGPTFSPNEKLAAALMIGPFGEASTHLEKGFRVGVGIQGSLMIQANPKLKLGLINEVKVDATKKFKKDYYNQLSFKQSYFTTTNTEWRFESALVSKFRAFTTNTRLFQFNYGFFF